MLDSLSVISPVLLPEGSHPRGLSGKLSVPVAPATAVYARFRHIVGVSASEPGEGVPLLKLSVLDNLIHHYLVSRGELGQGGGDIEVPVPAQAVDATIAAVGADLHASLAAQKAPFGGAFPETGIVLNVGV